MFASGGAHRADPQTYLRFSRVSPSQSDPVRSVAQGGLRGEVVNCTILEKQSHVSQHMAVGEHGGKKKNFRVFLRLSCKRELLGRKQRSLPAPLISLFSRMPGAQQAFA